MIASIALLALCVAGDAPARQDPKQVAGKLTGDDKGAAANNPVCRLFTPAEVAKYVGEPVSAPSNAASGSACQWAALDDTGDAMIQIVPASFHEMPRGSKGYRDLPDIGTKGLVAVFFDGWLARAIVGPDSISVSVAGAGASDATAIAMLRETIARRKK
jgi:hypothetical protein